ncbi:MAG: hypothetical protein Q9226_005390 [Calogaya cf. arnoldii]
MANIRKGKRVTGITYGEPDENTDVDIAQADPCGNSRKRPLSANESSEQGLSKRRKIQQTTARAQFDNNQPVLKYPHLPVTLSTRIKGEEILLLQRMDKRVEMRDLMDRMLKETDDNYGPVTITSRLLQFRRNGFRQHLKNKDAALYARDRSEPGQVKGA